MNIEDILSAISNTNDDNLTIVGINAAKENWAAFYSELEKLMDQFIAHDTSLTNEQEAILFFGSLLLAELKYSPALEKCLQLFSRSDSFSTPLEAIFGDALTEVTSTLFYNVADGNTQALCNYIADGHQAMYCKASAIEAVFAQYEAGVMDKAELNDHVTRWLAGFLAIPSSTNSFLLSVLVDTCINYQLDDFKPQFVALCNKGLFDEDRCEESEIKAWDSRNAAKLIESGIVEINFSVVDTLNAWILNDVDGELLDDMANKEFGEFDSLMEKGGLFDNILYDENTILENSVPVSSLNVTGRNEPCPCGSGKKYKKCCLN